MRVLLINPPYVTLTSRFGVGHQMPLGLLMVGGALRDDGPDLRACHLLREHEIFSVMGHIVGLGDESWAGFRATRRHLQEYDGDYLNAMYVTPHSWTQFAKDVKDRRAIQHDQRRWDYRHQVLEERFLRPWQLFFGVKWLELCFHLHPRKIGKLLRERDTFRRRQQWWTLWHTSHVWLAEIADFVCATKFVKEPEALEQKAQVVPLVEPRRSP